MTPSKTLAVLGNPVAFYPGLVPITGSIKATLMFCQIFYWCQRTTNPLGVYKSVADFEAEIHLSYKEQIAARKRLVELGLIVEEYDRAQHRVYFSVDTAVLDQLLLRQELAHDKMADDKREGGTCQKVSYHLTKGKFGNTETTTKTTQSGAAKQRTPSGLKSLQTYIDECKEVESKVIPDNHYVFRYAEDASIPSDLIGLCWLRFKEEHITGARKAKKQKDWPQTFANCVKDNWYGFWYLKDGIVTMSSKCEMYKNTIDAQRARGD